MDRTYMLSVTKVKQHGMTSTKWTTEDKTRQYKGLIALYTRDKKIMLNEAAKTSRLQSRQIKNLERSTKENRKLLKNVLVGDHEKLHVTLANHRRLQLRCHKTSPEKAIETVVQANFNKRKVKDYLQYKTKMRAAELIYQKLNLSVYEDRREQEILPSDRQALFLSGKVQNAILKQEAAVYIKNSYEEIIAIMKKDSIFFNVILKALSDDLLRQGNCLIGVIKFGMRGTEYLDDRRKDFKRLEQLIKEDMSNRMQDLASIERREKQFGENMKRLMSHDSDINLGVVKIPDTPSYEILQRECEESEKIFNFLKRSFATSNLNHLCPILKNQSYQKHKLIGLVQKCETSKTALHTLNDNAKVVYTQLSSAIIKGTEQYTDAKIELKNLIHKERERAKRFQNAIDDRYQLLAKLRTSLNHLQTLSRLLSNRVNKQFDHSSIGQGDVIPKEDDNDGANIIGELSIKFENLAKQTENLSNSFSLEKGFYLFEIFMRDRSCKIGMPAASAEKSLIEIDFVDPTVPTREDIIREGQEIIARRLKELECKPPEQVKKKIYKVREK